MTIKFDCTKCSGYIIFNDEDDVEKNTCTCKDNPLKNEEEK